MAHSKTDLNKTSGCSPTLSAEELHAISIAMERIFNQPSVGKAAA
jgi:hypothetical protein